MRGKSRYIEGTGGAVIVKSVGSSSAPDILEEAGITSFSRMGKDMVEESG
jgi:hypothetical protein